MEPVNRDLRPATHSVQNALAHSYFVYFLFLVIGVCLDLFIPLRIFEQITVMPIGFLLLVLASALIVWAQYATRHLHQKESVTKEDFCKGPYCYTRTPTHWGLFILTIGFGIVANAFFVVVTTILSFLLTKFFFVKKYDEALLQEYGTAYQDYKKEVKF